MTDTTSDETQRSGWRPSPKQVLAGVVLVLALVFVLLNTDKHTVNVYGWHPRTYDWLWMLILLVLGILIGVVLPVGRKKD